MELEVGPPVTGGLGLVEDEDVGFIFFHGNSRAQTGNFLKQKKLFSQAIKSKLEHPWTGSEFNERGCIQRIVCP